MFSDLFERCSLLGYRRNQPRFIWVFDSQSICLPLFLQLRNPCRKYVFSLFHSDKPNNWSKEKLLETYLSLFHHLSPEPPLILVLILVFLLPFSLFRLFHHSRASISLSRCWLFCLGNVWVHTQNVAFCRHEKLFKNLLHSKKTHKLEWDLCQYQLFGLIWCFYPTRKFQIP